MIVIQYIASKIIIAINVEDIEYVQIGFYLKNVEISLKENSIGSLDSLYGNNELVSLSDKLDEVFISFIVKEVLVQVFVELSAYNNLFVKE